MEVAPGQYQSVLASCQAVKGKSLKPTDLYEVMKTYYRTVKRTTKTGKSGSEEDEEILIAALNKLKNQDKAKEVLAYINGKSNKVKCFECGEIGHKSFECDKRYSSNNGHHDQKKDEKSRGSFKGKCRNCGKVGHKEAECWDKEDNAYLRPSWYKKPQETGNAVVSTDPEILMGTLDEPQETGNAVVSTDHEILMRTLDSLRERKRVDGKSDKDDYSVEATFWDYFKREEAIESYVEENEGKACKDMNEHLLAESDINIGMEILKRNDIWIADSAATIHTTPHEDGMVKTAEGNGNAVTVGNGESVTTKKYGNITGMWKDKHGKAQMMNKSKLQEVAHSPGTVFNLLSVTKMTSQGWILRGNEKAITLEKNGVVLNFDIKVRTPKGMVYCAQFERETELCNASATRNAKVSIGLLHQQLCHCGEDIARKTAKVMGIEITRGNLKICEDVRRAKRNRNLYQRIQNIRLQAKKMAEFSWTSQQSSNKKQIRLSAKDNGE